MSSFHNMNIRTNWLWLFRSEGSLEVDWSVVHSVFYGKNDYIIIKVQSSIILHNIAMHCAIMISIFLEHHLQTAVAVRFDSVSTPGE